MDSRSLSKIYRKAHNLMRNIDGLQPQEAFNELLKYLFLKQTLNEKSLVTSHLSPKELKQLLVDLVSDKSSWISKVWRENKFYLSDECLSDVDKAFEKIDFSATSIDVRSHALREFIKSDLRKGLGIFLTPEEVVSSIIKILAPLKSEKIYDPACGSGTFLIEYLNHIKDINKATVYGGDKSPQMMLLADLNLGHFNEVIFKNTVADSLKLVDPDEEFDVIATNPPFGISVDARDYDFSNFRTCQDGNGYNLKKQASEIVFIEQCFKLLKPGGRMAIVIPKSIATNNSLSNARKALSNYGFITGVLSLPPETFAATGTQTVTIVLFAQKYVSSAEKTDPNKIFFANIKNVGFDSTGRYRSGSELIDLQEGIKKGLIGEGTDNIKIINTTTKKDSFASLESLFIQNQRQGTGLLLEEICNYIGTGKTPPRDAYSDNGNFLIKVGNLSGVGINWEARDRNFVKENEFEKRKKATKRLILQEGDILLTSSAHSPVYIAKKCDIFDGAPEFLSNKEVSFVGEVMLVRPNKNLICPYTLLAYLRSPNVISTIQNMVRGQTAHLHAKDLGKLVIPKSLLNDPGIYKDIAKNIKEQNLLNAQINNLIYQQAILMQKAY